VSLECVRANYSHRHHNIIYFHKNDEDYQNLASNLREEYQTKPSITYVLCDLYRQVPNPEAIRQIFRSYQFHISKLTWNLRSTYERIQRTWNTTQLRTFSSRLHILPIISSFPRKRCFIHCHLVPPFPDNLHADGQLHTIFHARAL
jgi:hypothetical protein